MKAYPITALALLSTMPCAQAAESMKAFPPAEPGIVRDVLQLPEQRDEAQFEAD